MQHEVRFTWKIGGEAGFGIKSAGIIFAKACMRSGLYAFDYTEYPSLIRGGHNTYQVTVGERPVHAVHQAVDILVALNKHTIDQQWSELSHGAAVVYDEDEIKLSAAKCQAKNIQRVSVPFKKIIDEIGGGEIMRNTVAIGASAALIHLPLAMLNQIITELFASKPDAIALNIKALERGYAHVKDDHKKEGLIIKLEPVAREKRLYISGNEALGIGALAGGLDFFAGYPMTPSTTVLQYFAGKAVEQGLVFKHAEDEISAVNMAMGAAHVGARAMTATSGGGFALMGEGLGLCAVSETPLVLVDVQRPGPATGMPTWTDQGDLQFVLHAGQGEFPRIIAAPGDIEECFTLGAESLNWAEKYQLPVILLSDKFLGEGYGTVTPFAEDKVTIERGKLLTEKTIPKNYKRYKITQDGVSPRALPGMKNGIYWADSYEHTEQGFSSELASDRVAQVDKRARKLATALKELPAPKLYGSTKAQLILVAWGSTKGPILDAIELLPKKYQGKVSLLHFTVLWPLDGKAIRAQLESKPGLLARGRKVVLIENNSNGQLGELIRQESGIEIKDKVLKYDGRPFFVEELVQHITHFLQ
ncbi:MAG: 2-oxoacid:acceptor oxidoreductase subunit alpha [Candidatus Falkowbacteria bacterium]